MAFFDIFKIGGICFKNSSTFKNFLLQHNLPAEKCCDHKHVAQ